MSRTKKAKDALRRGKPAAVRSLRGTHGGFDKITWLPSEHWPDGLTVAIYDDGRIRVGATHTTVQVPNVSNYRAGASIGSAFVDAVFSPAEDE